MLQRFRFVLIFRKLLLVKNDDSWTKIKIDLICRPIIVDNVPNTRREACEVEHRMMTSFHVLVVWKSALDFAVKVQCT